MRDPAVDAGLVTVVISTLDRPGRLTRCLEALLAGSRQPSAVIVVDQGSTASAEQAVAAVRERGLVITRLTQPRWGLSASQNAGVRAARTDVVAIVDDDCVPGARWIEVIENAFTTTPQPLLLTGRVLPLPPEGDRTAAVSTRDSQQRTEWHTPPMPWHLGTGGNFAVSRAAFEAVGGNDEQLGTGGPGRGANDLDVFHRLVVAGVMARFEPDLLVHHERSTVDEYRSRRSTYGFGIGAMLGRWLRHRQVRALVVLLAWVRLRAGLAYRRRSEGGVGAEARVLLGTVAGLAHGLRNDGARRPDRG